MKAGIMLPHLGDSATRDNVLYIAKEAEREGLDSLWVLERLLWPLKPQTPYGIPGTLPVEYQNVLDPLETLTYLAGNTEQISLGTCVIDMLFHNPWQGDLQHSISCRMGGLLQVWELDGQKMSTKFPVYLTSTEGKGQTNFCNC